MKDALNTVISRRLSKTSEKNKLNSTRYSKLSKMSLNTLRRIDTMLHKVISKRFMRWKEESERIENLKIFNLNVTNSQREDFQRQIRVKRSKNAFLEKKLSPILKPHQLPSLDSWVRCGGPYLDFVPVKKRKRSIFKKSKKPEQLSKLCIQKLK